MQPQLCNNFRYWVFLFSPKFKKKIRHFSFTGRSPILFFKWSNFIQHIGILRFVLFVRKGNGIKSRCWVIWNVAGCVLCVYSQLLSIFFNEKKNEMKMLFPPFLGTWKEHVHHTHIHCTIQTILLLCVWFRTEILSYWFSLFSSFFFGSAVALVLFAPVEEREKGHWNVFVEQQIYFLIPNFVCLPFRYFLTYPTKMLKNRHGNRLAD